MSGSFTSLQLDTRAPEPLWRQLYSQLDDLLTSGAVQEGTSLPPERDLAEALGVSRSTVKRSYDQLRHDKRVGGRGRAGSVVRTPPERVQPTLGQLKGFTEEMQELGKFATSTLLVCEVVMTAMLLFVIMGSTHGKAPAGFAPIAIGLCLTLIHLVSIPVSNTSVNPARSSGVALFAQTGALSQLWLFWVAPIVGGMIGAVVYKAVAGARD